MASYQELMEQYEKDLADYKKKKAEWDSKNADYQNKLKQYQKDYTLYQQSLADYQACINETKTEDVVNGSVVYNMSVTAQSASSGGTMMDSSVKGNQFSIKYTSVLAGTLLGASTLNGYFTATYVALENGKVRVTLKNMILENWSTVRGPVSSWYSATRPSLIVKTVDGDTVWSLNNYDPSLTQTIDINKTVPINKSWDVPIGGEVPLTTVARIEDNWDFNNLGLLNVGFVNKTTISHNTVKAHSEQECRLLLVDRPTEPTPPSGEPIPPTPPTDGDFKPWAIRKGTKWQTINIPAGYFKIRKSGSWSDKSNMKISQKRQANQGVSRIRVGGTWLGQSEKGSK